MFCCTLLCARSSIAIILMGKRKLVALLYMSSWCLVIVERLFLAVSRGCLRFVIVVFPDHTHLLFLIFSKDNSFRNTTRDCGLKKLAKNYQHTTKVAINRERTENIATTRDIMCSELDVSLVYWL